MKVKMLVSISGTLDGKPLPERGEIATFPDHIAADLIANRYAERVENSKIETAAVDPVEETSTKAAAKPRKV